MDIILIAAITLDGFIAKSHEDTLEWTVDKAEFKKRTMGHQVVIGSTTAELISKPLAGRELITVHREDEPQKILASIQSEKCYIAGGAKTNARFAPYLTHIIITVHPIIFGTGIPLFQNVNHPIKLRLENRWELGTRRNVFQEQYCIIKE